MLLKTQLVAINNHLSIGESDLLSFVLFKKINKNMLLYLF